MKPKRGGKSAGFRDKKLDSKNRTHLKAFGSVHPVNDSE